MTREDPASTDPDRGCLEVRRLGRTPFEECYALQKELVEERAAGRIGDVLILTEHDPVVTLGRKTPPGAAARVSVPVVEVERGGEATYHGPGQLVAYPILGLENERRDLRAYLRDLEEVAIGVLGEFGVTGSRKPGFTGVWIGDRKVCSIGVAVRHWVTYHGLALNLHTDLEAFGSFDPCGLDAEVMTRLADHAELPPTNILGEVLLVKHFCRVFSYDLPAPPAVPGGGEHPRPGEGEDYSGPGFRSLPVLPH